MQKRPRFKLILAALFGLSPAALAAEGPKVELLGSYVWRESNDMFGGMSGLEITNDGAEFVAVSDGGSVWTGELRREAGKIVAVENTKGAQLKDTKGFPLVRLRIDAEGLAMAPDGRLFVSFEAVHRVWSYPNPFADAEWMDRHPDFRAMQNNSSLEALAIDSKGHIYTLPERSGKIERPFPVYRYANGIWAQPFALRRAAPFLATGADFGPDGRLYLLERHFTGILGFRTRVRRFTIAGDIVAGEETLIETETAFHDNLEGISVWRDSEGAIRITMISDDNFRLFQRTEFVEYRITE